MNCYIYQGALLCESCGQAKRASLPQSPDIDREDSDSYPQGPYSDGGGEADCPQSCDFCNLFLENPLTDDGIAYVADLIHQHKETGRGSKEVIAEWQSFYADCLPEAESEES